MKRLRYLLTAALMLCLAGRLHAQTERPWELYFGQLSTFEDIESADWEDTYEMLCDLEEEPLNINTATREDLLRLPFLNEQQVEDIQAYIYQYGAMKTIGELAMIETIDYPTRCLLSYFVQFGEVPKKDTLSMERILKYGHHDIVLTAGVPFYERRGDKEVYLGYQYSHSVRYKFRYSDRIKIGLVGSQDAGEPFFADKNRLGYDYYSLYAEAHRLGRLSTLVAGRYRASFGLGLVMNNDFSMGKLASLSALGSKGSGLRAHSSRNAAHYLQGAGATVSISKGLELTALASYRKVDATLSSDSTGITTLLTTDYHRTPTEMAKKRNTSETVVAADLEYRRGALRIGATALHTWLSRPLQPDTRQAYRLYYPAGDRFWNASAHYSYTSPLVGVRGEVATGHCGALATLHTLNVTPSPQLSLMALYRFYGKKYYSLHSNSFSEGGRVQNESGIYVGARWQPLRTLQLSAYSDFAYFPASKYQALASSHAWDNLVQAQYNTDKLSLTLRYRLKMREYDNSEKTALAWKTTHRTLAGVSGSQGPWQWGVRADLSYTAFEGGSLGWMASAQGGYSHRWLKVSASVGYFDTDDTESRVYGYESGPLYSYGFRSYDGEGLRYAFTARADLGSRLMVLAHLSTVDYLDRDHISTGYQRIDRSSKTDLNLQLRWRF